MVGDLTEDLIPSVFDVTKFPSLMLIRYDFDTKQNIIEKFEGDLS